MAATGAAAIRKLQYPRVSGQEMATAPMLSTATVCRRSIPLSARGNHNGKVPS